MSLHISHQDLQRYHEDHYKSSNNDTRNYVISKGLHVFAEQKYDRSNNDKSSIRATGTTTSSPSQGAIEINLNDIEIDPESLEGVMDVSDNPQVLEYLKFKHMHQENFLRDVANKGLKKPERTQPPPPPQPQRRSMNY